MLRLVMGVATTLAIVMPATAQQKSGSQGQRVYACEEIHKRCVNRSAGRSGACDGYFADAKRTGIWPAFGQSPAVACRR